MLCLLKKRCEADFVIFIQLSMNDIFIQLSMNDIFIQLSMNDIFIQLLMNDIVKRNRLDTYLMMIERYILFVLHKTYVVYAH